MAEHKKISVLGGGAWGCALACVLARHPLQGEHGRQADIIIWAREAETVAAINQQHKNPQFLPDIILPENITATQQLAEVAAGDILLMVVPAQFARGVLEALRPHWREQMDLVLCAKGIEQHSLKFMSQVAEEILPQAALAVLSGPSFAADVARGLPTAVTLASDNPQRGAALLQALGTEKFRLYQSDDIIGAEIGGVIKNVLAIACGIVIGSDLGESARAATTARGFAEMQKLADALGGKRATLTGLSGLGDLILTCSGTGSRNFSLGYAIGQGHVSGQEKTAQQILAERSSVSEGAMSASAVVALADKYKLEMPICRAVDAIINRQAKVAATIASLLARPLTAE